MEEKIDKDDLKYETDKYVYDFWQFRTKRSFSDSIFNSKNTKSEADKKV